MIGHTYEMSCFCTFANMIADHSRAEPHTIRSGSGHTPLRITDCSANEDTIANRDQVEIQPSMTKASHVARSPILGR